MSHYFHMFGALLIGLIVGIGATYLAIDRSSLYGSVQIGEWTTWSGAGASRDNPYSSAMLARSGEVPLASGEGISFFADQDSFGEALSGRCGYRVIGKMPITRIWTLSAQQTATADDTTAKRQHSIHSREMLYLDDEQINVVFSPTPQPNNWVPLSGKGSVRLALRLYDSPVASSTDLSGVTLPSVVREDCQ